MKACSHASKLSPKFMYQGLYIIPTHFRPRFEQNYPKTLVRSNLLSVPTNAQETSIKLGVEFSHTYTNGGRVLWCDFRHQASPSLRYIDPDPAQTKNRTLGNTGLNTTRISFLDPLNKFLFFIPTNNLQVVERLLR
jgi:hypothetical protein